MTILSKSTFFNDLKDLSQKKAFSFISSAHAHTSRGKSRDMMSRLVLKIATLTVQNVPSSSEAF